jgi:hypothetical protein
MFIFKELIIWIKEWKFPVWLKLRVNPLALRFMPGGESCGAGATAEERIGQWKRNGRGIHNSVHQDRGWEGAPLGPG